MPDTNAAGVALVCKFEGCALSAYPDPGTGGEPYSIGFGHTGSLAAIGIDRDVRLGDTITRAQAEILLRADLKRFEDGVSAMVDRDLTPNQFSALVSLAYNIGLGALKGSTLMRYVNEGDFVAAAHQFSAWVNGPNGPMLGLIRRRAAEEQLFEQ